ncbi:MAG: sugar phosphate isomerase/epimerase [Gemmataceae bacterium]|nr:sugar phosphate isomerase/epimerase [Gemmataceae bacterium]MDW8266106.1 TIM barrel protein [Gemmataceae bacterium]
MMDHRLSRRQALAGMTGAAAASLTMPGTAPSQDMPRSSLGLVIYSCGLRRRAQLMRNPKDDLFEPLTFLRHCHQRGAGGMQAALGTLDRGQVKALRSYAERRGLFIEGIVNPPQDEADLPRFEAEIRTAADVGALAVRTVIIPGRRYEQFKTLAEFRVSAARGQRMLELARPIVEKHRVRLAVENHKDQRLDERLALYERVKSEYIGACVDTGNNVALLDDPYETIEALAPYAFTVHLKDQAVRECDDGFLLGDIPLGQGCFDLPRMVGTLRKAKPNIRLVLEVITRDALRVPCLTEAYWATMPQVPARELARGLSWVRRHPASQLQQVSALPLDKQVALEDTNITQSLAYAREHLKL